MKTMILLALLVSGPALFGPWFDGAPDYVLDCIDEGIVLEEKSLFATLVSQDVTKLHEVLARDEMGELGDGGAPEFLGQTVLTTGVSHVDHRPRHENGRRQRTL